MRRIIFALALCMAIFSANALTSTRSEALPANPGITAAIQAGGMVEQARWGWGGHWGGWRGHWGGWRGGWGGWRGGWGGWRHCRHWWNGRWHPWCL